MNPSDAHHLGIDAATVAGNSGRGRVALLPGSVGRAGRIAERFTDHRVHTNDRRHDVHTGTLELDGVRIDAMTVPTGMGCPSVGIVVTELVALGVTRLLRVGTSGAMQPGSPAGGVAIATAAVRDESTSDVLAPRGVPAVAHPDWVAALTTASVALGLGDRTIRGVVHSKDSLYHRELPNGPLKAQNQAYMDALVALGVVATEMESSHLFTLAAALGAADLTPVGQRCRSAKVVKAGAVLALIGTATDGIGPADQAMAAEALSIDVGLRAAVELIRHEDGP